MEKILELTWTKQLRSIDSSFNFQIIELMEMCRYSRTENELKETLAVYKTILNAQGWQLCLRYLDLPYQVNGPEPSTLFEPLFLADWPREWREEYQRFDYLRCDPFMVKNRLSAGKFQNHQQIKCKDFQAKQRNAIHNDPSDLMYEQSSLLEQFSQIPSLQFGYSIGHFTPMHRWECYLAVFFEQQPESESFIQAMLGLLGEPILQASKRILQDQLRQKLTSRQSEVLSLVAQGQSKREISQQLSISIDTAADHVKKLFHIFGVHKSSEAAIIATELGLH